MTTPPVAQQQNFFQRPWVRRGGLILLGLIVLGLLFALWILGPTKTVNVPGPERTVIVTQEVIKTVEVPGGKEIVIETQEVVQTVIVTDEVPAEGTPMPLAETQVVYTGFPATASEVIRAFKLVGVREGDIQPCPDGQGGVEPECWEVKISPFTISNPLDCWLEGFRHNAGELRPGNYNRPELSGIPPHSEEILVDSGVTIRSCSAAAAAPTPGPLALDQEIESSIEGFPTSGEEAALMFSVDLENAELWACGEGHCFIFRSKVKGVPFNASNPTNCWMDGYRWIGGEVRPGYEQEEDAPKISVPPNSQNILVEEIVIRPCQNGMPTPDPATFTSGWTTVDEGVATFHLSNASVTPPSDAAT